MPARQLAPELLYIKFTRKEQTSLPALVLQGKSRTYQELLGFYLQAAASAADVSNIRVIAESIFQDTRLLSFRVGVFLAL